MEGYDLDKSFRNSYESDKDDEIRKKVHIVKNSHQGTPQPPMIFNAKSVKSNTKQGKSNTSKSKPKQIISINSDMDDFSSGVMPPYKQRNVINNNNYYFYNSNVVNQLSYQQEMGSYSVRTSGVLNIFDSEIHQTVPYFRKLSKSSCLMQGEEIQNLRESTYNYLLKKENIDWKKR